MAPDSDYKLAFKYLCQTLKTGEAIASEAKPSTGHASLKNVSQLPASPFPENCGHFKIMMLYFYAYFISCNI